MTRALFSILATWINAVLALGALAALMGAAILLTYARDLPAHEDLNAYRPPVISHLFDRDGRVLARFGEERRLFAPYEDIPEGMILAVLAAEDRNFFEHEGFDIRALGIALYEAVVSRGENLRGASTITQQVIKNFLLTPERTIDRKIQEILLAQQIEQFLSKEKILELYLNEIFLGQNSYGVLAASFTYFGRPLEELDWHEFAYLAALPQAPSRLHPVRDRDRAVARRNYVLGQLGRMEVLTPQEVEMHSAKPLHSVQSGHFEPHWTRLPARDHIVEEAQRQAVRRFGEESLARDGVSMHVGVDPALQKETAVMYRDALVRFDRQSGLWRGPYVNVLDVLRQDGARDALSGARVPRDVPEWDVALVTSVEGNSARVGVLRGGEWIEAVVGSQDVRVWRSRVSGERRVAVRTVEDLLSVGDVVPVVLTQSGDDWRAAPQQVPEVQGAFLAADVVTGRVLAMHGGFSFESSAFNRATQAQRQTGSSFKSFVFARGFEQGFHPASILMDAPLEIRIDRNQVWRPRNAAGRFYGAVSARQALERSFNVSTVALSQEVGLDGISELAERLGVYERMNRFPANVLGAQETTLWNMVQAYGVFATGGERFTLNLFDRVQDRDGQWLFRADQRLCVDCDEFELVMGDTPFLLDPPRPRVLDPVVAFQVTSVLQGAVERGTGRRAEIPGVAVAGKTGTTNDLRDVWFVGYTPNVVAGCYLGYDTPRTLGSGASGGSLCAPIFQEIVAHVESRLDRDSSRFVPPQEGEFVRFDRRTGRPLRPGQASNDVVVEFVSRSETWTPDENLEFVDPLWEQDLEDRLLQGLQRLDTPSTSAAPSGSGVQETFDPFVLPPSSPPRQDGSNYRWIEEDQAPPAFEPFVPAPAPDPFSLPTTNIQGLY